MSRVLVIAVAGVAITGLAVTGWRALSSPPAAPAVAAAPVRQIPMTTLLIAYRDLAPGAFIRPTDISTVSVAADVASPEAWRDSTSQRAALVGALVRRSIAHDTLLKPSDLLLAGDHGFLAALLQPGMRAFTITREQIVSGADLIWPGDHVDLILTQQMSGTSPGHQVSAETVLTALKVVAIDRALVQPVASDDRASGHSNETAGSVTLEVSPGDAEKLAVALRLGKVAFAVRPALPVNNTETRLVADRGSARLANTTWADTVMHSLDQAPATPPSISLHVYDGAGDKEYKF